MISLLILAGLLTLATAVPAFAAHEHGSSGTFTVEAATNDNPSGAGDQGDVGLDRGTEAGAVESRAADGTH